MAAKASGVLAIGVLAIGLSRASSESIDMSACQPELKDIAGVSGLELSQRGGWPCCTGLAVSSSSLHTGT